MHESIGKEVPDLAAGTHPRAAHGRVLHRALHRAFL